MTAHLPESLAASWRSKGSRTGESSILLASITAETTVFEPADPEDGLGAAAGSEIPIRSLFTVDLSISPSLSSLGIEPESALEKAAPKAKSQFVETLEDEGLVVDETRETLEFEAANGEAGAWYVFDVAYPIDGGDGGAADGDANSDAGANTDSDADPERIDAEGHIAVWPLESTFGMAGGVLPLSSADGAVDVAPEGDRETITELIRSIEFEPEGGAGAESDADADADADSQ